jgi:hypothetical protein
MNKKIKVRKPRRIVFYSPVKKERERDEEALLLIARGLTMSYIIAQTGHSKHQYAYLAKRAGVRLGDARNCTEGTLGGDFQREILKRMRGELEPRVIRYIRRNVTPPQIIGRAHTGPKGEHPYPLEDKEEKRAEKAA